MSNSSVINDNGDSEVYFPTVKSVIPEFSTRPELPSPAVSKEIGIFGILKHAIGKDLSRFAIPIVFNEPLSMLQRLAEYMEYHRLLDQASASEDPLKRIELVTAFALSTLASGNVRLSKPFNPLLFETFEFSEPELGFEFVAEQISHHPPISAFFCKSKNFEFSGTVEPRIKFWGKSIEVLPNAQMNLKILNKNETYSWRGCDCSINNIILGKMYMALQGQMVIKCPENDLQSIMKFRGSGKNGPDVVVTGEVVKLSNPEEHLRVIYGNWTEFLASTHWGSFQANKHIVENEFKKNENLQNERIIMFREGRLLWRVYKKPPNSANYYHMTYFSMMLNELPQDPSKLPQTDARFRPDMRFLENGDVDKASKEKERLENKQREKAKINEKKTKPFWFDQIKENGTSKIVFNGRYFNRNFTDSEDIF